MKKGYGADSLKGSNGAEPKRKGQVLSVQSAVVHTPSGEVPGICFAFF